MTDIFISFAEEDSAVAEQVGMALREREAAVWWDRNLQSGERYIDTILRQIQLADHVLLLLTEQSRQSLWVAFEIGAARSREAALGREEVLKIAMVGDCDIPGFIGDRQASRLSNQPTEDEIAGLALELGISEYPYPEKEVGPDARGLVVYSSGAQWMELVATDQGIDCVLVDSGARNARRQWTVPASEVDAAELEVLDPVEGIPPTFNFGGHWHWRWTPTLFKDSADKFREAVEELKAWRRI